MLGGVKLTKFPALLDTSESANLRLLDTANEATQQTKLGAIRLFVLARASRTQNPSPLATPTLKKSASGPRRRSQKSSRSRINSSIWSGHEAFYVTNDIRDAHSFEAQRLLGRKTYASRAGSHQSRACVV